MKNDICTTFECGEKARCKGLCSNCYAETKRRSQGKPKKYSAEYLEKLSLSHRRGLSSIDPHRLIGKDGKSRSIAVSIVSRIRHHAYQRGYTWCISDIEAYNLIVSKCSYCGIESGWPTTRNTIDRKDSSLGYILGNCVSACLTCNHAKRDEPFSNLLLWAKRFAEHNRLK